MGFLPPSLLSCRLGEVGRGGLFLHRTLYRTEEQHTFLPSVKSVFRKPPHFYRVALIQCRKRRMVVVQKGKGHSRVKYLSAHVSKDFALVSFWNGSHTDL